MKSIEIIERYQIADNSVLIIVEAIVLLIAAIMLVIRIWNSIRYRNIEDIKFSTLISALFLIAVSVWINYVKNNDIYEYKAYIDDEIVCRDGETIYLEKSKLEITYDYILFLWRKDV